MHSGLFPFFVLLLLGVVVFLKKQTAKNETPLPKKQNGTDKLAVIRNATYRKKKLLNLTEKKVYWALRSLLGAREGSYQVFPQVSLGEIFDFKENKRNEMLPLLPKRVDFCIVNASFAPMAVVEVQGGGHYQKDWAERDEMKRISTHSAGIRFVNLNVPEVDAFSEAELVEKLNFELSAIFAA